MPHPFSRRSAASSEAPRRTRGRVRTALVAAVAFASAAALAAPAQAAPGREVNMNFNGLRGGSTVTRVAGVRPGLAARVLTAHNGSVRSIKVKTRPRQGHALRFPRFDGTRRGPRAVLRIVNTGKRDYLNPGRHNFLVRADFRIDADSDDAETRFDNGDNLVQRGQAGSKHQYKLELDDHRLSCWVENARGVRTRATVPVAVDARHWYRAQCSRRGTALIARLTKFNRNGTRARSWVARGQVRGVIRWASSAEPVTVGGRLNESGKRFPRGGDQFNGVVDNVVVNILR